MGRTSRWVGGGVLIQNDFSFHFNQMPSGLYKNSHKDVVFCPALGLLKDYPAKIAIFLIKTWNKILIGLMFYLMSLQKK